LAAAGILTNGLKRDVTNLELAAVGPDASGNLDGAGSA
jgi:hypothetical protein